MPRKKTVINFGDLLVCDRNCIIQLFIFREIKILSCYLITIFSDYSGPSFQWGFTWNILHEPENIIICYSFDYSLWKFIMLKVSPFNSNLLAKLRADIRLKLLIMDGRLLQHYLFFSRENVNVHFHGLFPMVAIFDGYIDITKRPIKHCNSSWNIFREL